MPCFNQNRNYILVRLLLFVLLICFSKTNLLGQEDCSTKIQDAKKLYDQGLIDEIPKMLTPCIENGFTRVQKIEAYKLIILSYLFNDDQFQAERTMVEFLKKFPEYEIMPNDPVEFVYLFDSYRTTSVISIGLLTGFNFTDPRIIEPYSMLDLSKATLKNNPRSGFQVGFGMGRYLNKRLMINAEFYYLENRYSFTDKLNLPPLSGGISPINTIVYDEKLFQFDLPVTLSYEFNTPKFHYFIRGGFSFGKISAVQGQATRKYSETLPLLTGENMNVKNYRRKMIYSGLLGAGIRYKVPHGVILVELRTNIGINNIVLKNKRYQNQELMTKYYYLDDDFSLNMFSLSAGYYFSFYKPKKLTQ